MLLGLQGKRVLITGSSRGIGSAIAAHFLQEGARVCIVARDNERLLKTFSSLSEEYDKDAILSFNCDCSSATELDKLYQYIGHHWQGLDVLVANVGSGVSVPDPLPDAQQWSNTWQSNFEPAISAARTFLPMLECSKGSLTYISSIAGLESIGAPVDYSTAKAAIQALSKNMARKLGGIVRVNVVAPGNVLFEGGAWDKKYQENPEKVQQLIEKTVPMKRFAKPEEIADAVVFMSSERASFITGSTLVVDGGQTVGIL